ncbi:liprin-beta-1-like isoform X3 [Leptotrombidium deliense]|uniref:Liprin-beta-1-like isoform X3 n=1 Tax=Leptotrombidium deliense TaxID=299467 RepID=A0A443ST07_9ACAR|nr:liprin-beta-1-like isoform X3 [Leptotrombidium deliense]
MMQRVPVVFSDHESQIYFKEFEEKIGILEYEKEQLVQQVSALEEQREKILQLESAVSDLKSQLNISERLLEDSLRSRSLLENQTLHLKNEISKLKHIVGIHTNEADKQTNNGSDAKVAFLKMTLLEKETEIGTLRLALAKLIQNTGYPLTSRDICLLRGKSQSSESLAKKGEDDKTVISEKPPFIPRQPRSFGVIVEPKRDIYNHKSSSVPQSPLIVRGRSSSPKWRSRSTNDDLTVTEEVHYNTLPRLHGAQISYNVYEENGEKQNISLLLPSKMSNDFCVPQPIPVSPCANGNNKLTVASIGKKFLKLKRGTRSSSVPVIDRRKVQGDSSDHPRFNQRSNPDLARISAVRAPSEQPVNKAKGLKKIFENYETQCLKLYGDLFVCRMKRSTSSTQGFDEFSRGGFRATTGSRSGYLTNHRRKLDVNRPFVYWEPDLVSDWFAVIGLGMYSHNCRKWIKNGDHLMRLTSSELEKGLNMKNPLHRKKLKLALSCFNNECDNVTKCANELDYLWIAKWLDDIGLSQYKEAFVESRVDGAVLHHLTIEELMHLKINTYLHYCSIRRGIEVLRKNFFNPHCLKKRIEPEEQNRTDWTTSEISLWTCVRVMEWLRSIDLPEYAPNLSGTGVTGALIVYEAAFNADLLATLINIPANKTLLRRHLTLQFEKLIGPEISAQKRDYESQPGHTPLLATTKFKAYRGNHFSIVRRKSKNCLNYDDFVCPILTADDISQEKDDISIRGSIESNCK